MNVLIILVSAFLLQGSTADELFSEANRLYDERAYAEAIAAYQQLIGDGYGSAEVLYNLGNSYYRTEAYGLARLHYERALRQHPGFADARYNIRFMESRLLQPQMREENFSGLDSVMFRLTSIAPPSILLPVALGAFLFLNIVLGVRILFPQALGAGVRWVLIILLSAVTLLCLALAFAGQQVLQSRDYGIVLQAAEVQSEPTTRAPSRFAAPPALRVRIIQQTENWVEVMLPNGSRGWISSDTIAVI